MAAPAFNSRSTEFKSPFGAAAAGKSLKFNIKLACKTAKPHDVKLVIARDGEDPDSIDMELCGNGWEYDIFTCEYTASETGVYFYRFNVMTNDGLKYISNDGGGIGSLSVENGVPFQQTIYSPSFKTPDWIKGGIMYQIFPDRFCREGNITAHCPHGLVYLNDWGKLPPQSEEGGYCSNYYFGGNLKGIISKLTYLKSLGVTAVYMNPIFEANAYHRYNTADYNKVDPLLGTEDDFKKLCKKAGQIGIRIILDGVFSHTGDDSIYFNKYEHYPDKGAYESKDSKYYQWYDFEKWPDKYRCWWGFEELPEVNEDEPSYLEFITGENGVIKHWLKSGASGWRLDVADELPDKFLNTLRGCVKKSSEDNIIIGEVWEDASNKISYGERRHYLEGQQLDSVMNYPWRTAVIDFLKTGDALKISESVMSVIENYPKQSLDTMMNLLGSHDTIRLITCLAGESAVGKSISWKQFTRMTPERRSSGINLVKLACAIQYFLPGVPCIYYGDEAGFEGYEDPFNRQCYEWGHEEAQLLEWYKRLGKIRNACPALKEGTYRLIEAEKSVFAFERSDAVDSISTAVNAGNTTETISIKGRAVMTEGGASLSGGILTLPAKSCAVLGSGNWIKSINFSKDVSD